MKLNGPWTVSYTLMPLDTLIDAVSCKSMFRQCFLHTSHKYVHNLVQFFCCHRISRGQQTMVTLCPLQVCATTKGHDYEAIRKATLLDQEGKLFAFEVVPLCFGRVKIKLDAPEQPDEVIKKLGQDPLQTRTGSYPPPRISNVTSAVTEPGASSRFVSRE